MPSCVAIRHVAFEDLGLLQSVLAARGFSVRYLEAGIDALTPDLLTAPELVVVLGGPIGVYEEGQYPFLQPEIAAVRARLQAGKPTLGICLGAQLMAKALGAEVAPGPAKEIGWSGLTLTEDGKQSVLAPFAWTPVLHWHGDNFALPEGATRLASTAACPNQAFSIGRSILGLQFHIEADPARIEQWLVGHTVELGKAGVDPREIRRQAVELGPLTAKAGREVLDNWLQQALAAS
ncbi:MAG: glutamine amidotransferase [Bradyrhizobiaceae bacterium]|nr:glutamine amidotransferase [Bradyrhizobiaceae bacterium]